MSNDLITVKLHGFMGKKYAKTVKLAAENRFQMMAGLEHRFGPEFMEDIRLNDWHLCEGTVAPGNDRNEDNLDHPFRNKVIHLVPYIKGENSVIGVIIGAVLMVVGFFTANPYLIGAGAAMAIGGAVSMMMTPKVGGTDNSERGSAVFNGAVNITSQGGAMPVLYGRHRRASSVVISTDFSSDRVG